MNYWNINLVLTEKVLINYKDILNIYFVNNYYNFSKKIIIWFT